MYGSVDSRRQRVELARSGRGLGAEGESTVSPLAASGADAWRGEGSLARDVHTGAKPAIRLPEYIVGTGASQDAAAYGAPRTMSTTDTPGDFAEDGDDEREPPGVAGGVLTSVGATGPEARAAPAPKAGAATQEEKPKDWCTPARGDLQRWPWAGMVVLVLCLAGFLVSIGMNGWKLEPLNYNPLIGPSVEALIKSGAKDTPLMVNKNEWWRMVTQLFLHGGLVHLLMNMYVLVRHGWPLERHAGTQRFLPIYILSGLMASVSSAVFLPDIVSVGASGAIFGLIGAIWGDFLMNYAQLLEHKGGCRACLFTVLALSISTLINLAIGLLPFVDNFAHLGGFVGGALTGLVVMIRPREDGVSTSQRLGQYTAIGCYVVLVGMGLLSLFLRWDVVGWCPICRAVSCVPSPYWECGYEDVLNNGEPPVRAPGS
jgi:membrane associated rhomboid family serine protease